MAKLINENEFQAEVLDKKGVVLVDFFATWCGPCKTLGPIIDALTEKMGDQVTIVKVDIDQNPNLAAQNRVMSVPTMKIFKAGEVKETLVGLRTETELKEKLDYYNAG